MGKDKKDAKKAAPAAKKENSHQLYKNYKVSGDSVEKKNSSCPKCGDGFLMAEHKDRKTCGKCGYMEKK